MYALFYIYFIIYTLLYIKLFCGFISPRCPLLVCLPCWWWYSFCWCIFPAGVGVFPDGVGVFPDGVGVSLLVCLPCWCVFPAGVSFLMVLVSFLVAGGCLPAGGVSAASILQPDTQAGDTRGSSVRRRSRVRIEVSR